MQEHYIFKKFEYVMCAYLFELLFSDMLLELIKLVTHETFD